MLLPQLPPPSRRAPRGPLPWIAALAQSQAERPPLKPVGDDPVLSFLPSSHLSNIVVFVALAFAVTGP